MIYGRTALFVINLFNATHITGFPRPTPSTCTAHKDVSTQTTSPQRLTPVLLLQVHNLDLHNLQTLNFNPLQAIPTQAKVLSNHPDLVKDLVDLLPTKTLLALLGEQHREEIPFPWCSLRTLRLAFVPRLFLCFHIF